MIKRRRLNDCQEKNNNNNDVDEENKISSKLSPHQVNKLDFNLISFLLLV